MGHLQAGARAANFELKTADGHVGVLEEALADGPVALVFFKSSCPTCQFTMPYIQKLYAATGVASTTKLWGISQDEPGETQRFVKDYGLTFDVLIDPHPYDVSSAYGLESVPTLFIVGSDGIVRLSDCGFTKSSLREVSKALAEGTGRQSLELFSANDGLPASRPG